MVSLKLLYVNLLQNKDNRKNNYKHNYNYSCSYNHSYNAFHKGTGLLIVIRKIATYVEPLDNSGYDQIHSKINITCGCEFNGYKHKNTVETVITYSDNITVFMALVLIEIRNIVNCETLSIKNYFLCALRRQFDRSKEKKLYKQQSYKKSELIVIFSFFHVSTLNLVSGSGPGSGLTLCLHHVEMYMSLLVFKDDRCHHRTQKSLQRCVVNQLHVWGQTLKSIREDTGDIAELQNGGADTVAPAGSAVVNNDNAIVAVAIIGGSSCSVVTVVGSCEAVAVAVIAVVVAGRGGARRARQGKSTVGGRTNTDEMCLNLMTRNQRNVGYDLVISEQEVPRQTAYRTMKEELKFYIIENLIFTNLKIDVV